VARLRVLLVSKADAESIASLDSIYSKHNVLQNYFDLPEVAVRRVVLNKSNTANYNELKRAYFTALTADPLINDLSNGISKIATDFKSLLNLNITDDDLNTALVRLKNLVAFSAYSVPFNVQYRYDCIKDIADTYNELKGLLTELKEECCPDINAFPKHLMLGDLAEIGNPVKHHRHSFYKSPILNAGSGKIKQCQSLFKRMMEMISQFQIVVGNIKITPSNKLPELSFRSIPFYYTVDDALLSSWNYFRTEKNRQNTNLSYHTENLSKAPYIQNPLSYNLDRYDFYRIEGHQGKVYQAVLEEIDALKTQNGLAFDVKALSVNINTENLNIDDYQCEFEDLNVLLRAWTAEQECVLAEVASFFSGFSTKVPGANIKDIGLSRSAVLNLDVATNLNRFSINTNVNVNTAEINQLAADAKISQATTVTKSNVIADNLTIQPDALGSVMKLALDQTVGGSVNDIIAKANSLVSDLVMTDEWKNQPEVKAFVIDQSIELMAFSQILTQRMPLTLIDVNAARISSYKLTMDDLCTRVKRMKASYQTVQLSTELKAFMGILINQLSNVCCSGKKLQILLEEVDKRKQDILVRLQLSSFIETNPGLEHLAGVQPGGTFILVYLNKVTTAPTLSTGLRDLTSVANLSNSALVTNRSALKDTQLLTDNVNNLIDINSNLGNLNLSDLIRRPVDPPNYTVVADFSLPYMCCSDCSPVNFIVQKPPVTLRLEKDEFCLGNDTSPLLFEVSPADGVIKSDPVVAGVTIDGIKLNINPELFPDDMIGKPIHFTVNEQVTLTQLTVYRGVEFDFEVPESPTAQTKITFIPSGNLDGCTFLWSFGDDSSSTERNPTHGYKLPVNKENKVTVSLTVTASNGVCHSTVEHEITFKIEDTKINLDKLTYCSNDQNSYPFIVSPAGISAKIEGFGVEQSAAGGFVFVPAKAGIGEISFNLNGASSGLKATVNQAPVASFTPKQVGNQLILTNTSTNAVSYVWSVNTSKFESADNSPLVIDLTPNSPTVWILSLQANSETCGNNVSGTIQFPTTVIAPVNTCTDDAKAAMVQDRNLLIKLQMPNSDIVNRIWTQTSALYGGTTQFSQGVLNDVDNYLSGKNNANLETLFVSLLKTTAKLITGTDRVKLPTEFNTLVQLFALQLRLYYNILGCQNPKVIDEFNSIIQSILNLILELLQTLKQFDVTMPDSLKSFMKAYAVRVEKIALLLEHLTKIKDGNLI
jgi:PKD repeat protein